MGGYTHSDAMQFCTRQQTTQQRKLCVREREEMKGKKEGNERKMVSAPTFRVDCEYRKKCRAAHPRMHAHAHKYNIIYI